MESQTNILKKKYFSVFFSIYFQKIILLLVLVADIVFLSRVSDDVVAGVGCSVPLIYSLVAVLIAFSCGGSSLIARAIGAKQIYRARVIFYALLIIGVGVGVILTTLLMLLSFKFGIWLNISPEAAQASKSYIQALCPMLILDGLFLGFSSTLNVFGNNVAVIYSSIALVATNIILNSLVALKLVPGIELGPSALAWATLISQLPPLAIMYYSIKKQELFRLPKEYFMQHLLYEIKRIIKIGLPTILEPISINIYQLIIIFMIAKFGTAAATAFTYCRNYYLLISNAGAAAMGTTTLIYVSHLIGEKQWELADRRLKLSLVQFLPCAFAIFLLLKFFSGFLLGIFTQDVTVLELGKLIFSWMIASELFRCANLIIFPNLRGGGDVKNAVIVSVVSYLLLGGLAGWALSQWAQLHLKGVLTGMILAEGVRSVSNYLFWHSRGWKKSATEELKQEENKELLYE